MYAIVKAGGRQEKVTVGETILVDHLDSKSGATVSFSAVLVVDGATVTSDPKALSSVKVTGEVIDDVKEVATGYECGLNIQNFNNIEVGDIVESYEQVEVKRKL